MEMRFRSFEQQVFSIDTKEVMAILPFKGVLALSQVNAPYDGLFLFEGKIIPVMGPLPQEEITNSEQRPWILVCRDHAQVVAGLPEILDQELRSSQSL